MLSMLSASLLTVTLASTSEFPMQWHELELRQCGLRLLQRDLELPELRTKSIRRDTRPGRNQIKQGGAGVAEGFALDTCSRDRVA